MVKHSQTIRRQKPSNCLSVFDYFWGGGLALKGLTLLSNPKQIHQLKNFESVAHTISRTIVFRLSNQNQLNPNKTRTRNH